MSVVATPEFHARYRVLPDRTAECLDAAILRILSEPDSAWARQNRVRGELGSAWLVVVKCDGEIWNVYWRWPRGDDPLQLLLLLPG